MFLKMLLSCSCSYRQSLGLDIPTSELFLLFHAITGCDTTSFLSGHIKKTALKTVYEHKEMLLGLGHELLSKMTLRKAETFICRIYNVPDVASTNEVRVLVQETYETRAAPSNK